MLICAKVFGSFLVLIASIIVIYALFLEKTVMQRERRTQQLTESILRAKEPFNPTPLSLNTLTLPASQLLIKTQSSSSSSSSNSSSSYFQNDRTPTNVFISPQSTPGRPTTITPSPSPASVQSLAAKAKHKKEIEERTKAALSPPPSQTSVESSVWLNLLFNQLWRTMLRSLLTGFFFSFFFSFFFL